MYTKKQHIARKTIITLLAFAGGMVSTVLAAAVYDASVQSRATTIFDAIKNNASTMTQPDSLAYYQLVRLNIKSLVEVLTEVDGKILTEIGSTIPGLETGSIISDLTHTGKTDSGAVVTLCTTEYAPVCALVSVQCITAPCPQVKETFSNSCMAKSKNATVISNTACDGASGPLISGTTTTSNTNSFEVNKTGMKAGETVDLQYSVSLDRTCNIYAVKSGRIIKKDIGAGMSGTISYVINESDINSTGTAQLEMGCSNGSKITKNIQIIGATGGFTSTESEVLNKVAKIYTYQVNEGMQVSEYVDATEELARRQCADRQNYFNNALAIKDKRDIKIRCTWKGFEFCSYTPANDLGVPSQTKNIMGSMEEIGKIPEKATNNRDYFFAYLDNSVNPVNELSIITEAEAKVRCQELHNTYPKSSLQCTWRGLMFNSYAKESAVVGPTPFVVGPTTPTTTSNSQLVIRRQQIADLYRSVLGREPDEPGLNYWVNDSMTIEQIRANFVQVRASEQAQENTTTVVGPSPFVVGPTAPVTTSPVVVGPTVSLSPRAQQISDLYRSVLGREPDEAGLNYWVNDSMTIDQIRDNFLNSPEYQQNNR